MSNDLNQVIEKTGDDELFHVVTNYLFDHVCRRMESYQSYSKRMTTGQRMLILMWCLCAEAANGGIHQFLSNSSGDEADETIDHLKRIGALKQVEGFEAIACEVFNGDIPKNRRKRNQLLVAYEGDEDSMSEVEFEDSLEKAELFFENIDKQFGWCEEIRALATKYIRENREEFQVTETKPKAKRWWSIV